MIRVNLLPQKRVAKTDAPSQRWLLFVLAALLLESAAFYFFHRTKDDELQAQKTKNAALQGKIAEITKLVANHEDIKKSLSVLRAREDAIAKLQAGRSGPTALLIELAQVLTPGKGPTTDPERIVQLRKENPNLVYNPGWDARRLWLTAYVEAQRVVKVDGVARDGSDVSEFAQRLKLSTYFYDVRVLAGHRENEKDTKLELVSFAVQARARY